MSRFDWHPPQDEVELVVRLLDAVPELADSYHEHLLDNDELLPYHYLPDAVRALELMMHQGRLTEETRSQVAALIEAALEEGGSIRNLALLGLVEEIANAHVMSVIRSYPSLLECMRDAFGPLTKEALSDDLADSAFLNAKPQKN